MSIEALKSTTITNLDASTPPILLATAGEGGAAPMKVISDYATVSASASITSTYQLCRLPSNAKVKNVWLESEAQTAGTFNIGLSYSTSTRDGTPAASQGTVISATQFASAVDCSSAVRSDVTNQAGNFNLLKRNQPLWQAVGLASDPGGFFDVVATVVTVAVTTGTGKIGVIVDYTD